MKIVFQTASGVMRRRLPRVRGRLVGSAAWNRPLIQAKTRLSERKPAIRFFIRAFRSLMLLLSIASFGVLAVVFVPDVYYRLFPADTQPVAGYQQHVSEQAPRPTPSPDVVEPMLPAFDASLPEGDWLVIPRIGVRTELRATANPEDALQKGVWQVPDYGQPGDTDIPMILAGHRYGWQWWWKTDYWKYNSFYNLPSLEVGDRIEVIADQRKWVYQVYMDEEGQEITDYDADLILYTCKFLNSPIRYFRYAKLVPPAAV